MHRPITQKFAHSAVHDGAQAARPRQLGRDLNVDVENNVAQQLQLLGLVFRGRFEHTFDGGRHRLMVKDTVAVNWPPCQTHDTCDVDESR